MDKYENPILEKVDEVKGDENNINFIVCIKTFVKC
jgi:hypothetical protein